MEKQKKGRNYKEKGNIYSKEDEKSGGREKERERLAEKEVAGEKRVEREGIGGGGLTVRSETFGISATIAVLRGLIVLYRPRGPEEKMKHRAPFRRIYL